MNWQTKSSKANQEIYELTDNGKKQLTLTYHPDTISSRIEFGREKRVFMIRLEGFRKNKVVLCNEYGVRMAWVARDPKSNTLEINDEVFHYLVRKNPKPEVVIYRDDIDNPLIVCGLDITNESSPVTLANGKIIPRPSFSSLLLALGWYVTLPELRKAPEPVV